MDPVSDFVDYLDGDSTLGLTKGTDLFEGPLRAVGDYVQRNAVFVHSIGGPEPQRVMTQTSEIQRVVLSVTTRWDRYSAGNTKAQAVQNALQGASISGYLDVRSTESLPTLIGQDAQANSLFMSMFELVRERLK